MPNTTSGAPARPSSARCSRDASIAESTCGPRPGGRVGHGRPPVVGVVVETPAGRTTVRARQGVVLATGGFEWDPELVRSFIRGPLERSVSVPTNTGDGLKMAMRIGAALGNIREAWWAPTIDVPDDDGTVHRGW